MVKMIASKSFPYQGRALKKGDQFDARDKSHARQLRGAGFATDAVKRGRPAKVSESVDTAAPIEPVSATDTGTAVKTVLGSDKDKDPVKYKDTAKDKTSYQTRVLNAED